MNVQNVGAASLEMHDEMMFANSYEDAHAQQASGASGIDVDGIRAWVNGLAVRHTALRIPADAAAGKKLLSDEMLGSLHKFMACFREEEACRDALFYLRWPNGFLCPQCIGHHYYYIRNRKLYECTECGSQTSVTANTFLHGTKLPLAYWFFTIYWVAVDQRCTAYRLAAVLQLHYRTALRMLHVIRAAMRIANGTHLLSYAVHEEEQKAEEISSGKERIQGDGLEYAGNRSEVRKQKDEGLQEGEKGRKRALKPGRRGVYPQRDPLLERCRSMLVAKAEQYIRATYRRVGQNHRQRYVDEFFYLWMQRYEKNPVHLSQRLLQACGTLVDRMETHLSIRPVFPSCQNWFRRSVFAHPDQAA